jgi:hypothetical protein
MVPRVEDAAVADLRPSKPRRKLSHYLCAGVVAGTLGIVGAAMDWHWLTDRMPLSLTYPRTTQVTRTDDGNGACRNTTMFAFGYVWEADAQVGPGTFRQLDRTHGVLNGVRFTGGVSRFSSLNCVIQ